MIMKLLILFSILLTLCSCEVNAQKSSTQENNEVEQALVSTLDTALYQSRLEDKITQLQDYLKKNTKYNQKLAVLIDMKKPSQYKRFYVVNMDSLTVISSGLVAHGSGSETIKKDSLQFSNTPNSYMTSLGKYKIGVSYVGNFGKSYKLHGLEPSNSKAFERFVVLHPYGCVPDHEQLEPICHSLGCPMLSELYFKDFDKIISSQINKNIVLEIFY
ncbi:MAG: hypothetical protein E6Q89_05805 [Bacteroidia bacterium]|nr:MAG: hypothetical protein E6Q89_05805 [Bacteroidia bacterium]